MTIKLAVLLLTLSSVRAQNGLCSSPITSTLKLSVNSRYNATGHHIIQADVSDSGHNGTALDVETTTAICGDQQTGRLSAVAVRQPGELLRPVTAAPAAKSPPGYEHVPGLGTYKVHTERKPWVDAFDVCVSEGAHLLVVNSQQEADLVAKMCSKVECHTCLWIGFHDYFKEKHFVTVTGQLLSQTGYTTWKSSEPGGSSESCGCICVSQGLCDDTCNTSRAFICEI